MAINTDLLKKINPLLLDDEYFIDKFYNEGIMNIDVATGINRADIKNAIKYRPAQISIAGNTKQDAPMLPNSYTQVDYIENTGNSYIDTGLIGNMYIEGSAQYTDTSAAMTQILFGQSSGASRWFGVGADSNGYIKCDHTYEANPLEKFTFSKSYYFVDNVNTTNQMVNDELFSWNNASSNYSPYNLVLFNTKATVSPTTFRYPALARIYSFTIYTDAYKSVKIADLIPCYRNSDNEVGMYDIVNNVFYTNSGDGAFVYGSAIDYPTPNDQKEISTITGNIKLINDKNCAKIMTLLPWQLTENNTIKNTAQNVGVKLFETIRLKKGQTVRLYFKLISKPTKSTSFTTFLYGKTAPDLQGFINIHYFTVNTLYTRTITITEDTNLNVRMYGNADNERFEFQYWVTIDNPLPAEGPQEEVTISLGNNELCKNKPSTVFDTLKIDTETGVVTKTKNIIKKRLTRNMGEWYTWNTTYFCLLNDNDATDNEKIYCNMFDTSISSANHLNVRNAYDSGLTTLEDFLTFLDNNEVYVYYRLATPVEEIITTLSSSDLKKLEIPVELSTKTIKANLDGDLTVKYIGS